MGSISSDFISKLTFSASTIEFSFYYFIFLHLFHVSFFFFFNFVCFLTNVSYVYFTIFFFLKLLSSQIYIYFICYLFSVLFSSYFVATCDWVIYHGIWQFGVSVVRKKCHLKPIMSAFLSGGRFHRASEGGHNFILTETKQI